MIEAFAPEAINHNYNFLTTLHFYDILLDNLYE